jgi:hypothetical protein
MTAKTETLVDPKLVDVLEIHKSDIFKSLRCASIGKISKFDTAKKTAEVQILFKRVLPSGESVSYPPLVDCPVVTLNGGGAALQFPVSVGDTCLVLFSDRNIDAWFKAGVESVPFDGRCHDLSDGIVLVGLEALNGTLPAYPADESRIISGAAKVAVKKDGTEASLKQGTGEVSAVGGKVRIKSTSTDLLTALGALIDTIKGIQIVDPQGGVGTVSPTSATALDASKTTLQGLLST